MNKKVFDNKLINIATVSLRKSVEILFFVATIMLVASCENEIPTGTGDDPLAEGETATIKITSQVAGADFQTTMRSGNETVENLTDKLCSRFDIAIYRNGERVINKAQKAGDSDFGTMTAELEIGTSYQIVVIAHNCQKAMTTTDIAKITADREVTDMFWAYEEFTPTSDGSLTMTLHRIVALVKFRITEPTPTEATSMYFYYTGGSSTFDGTTGIGSVNSKQNITIEVPSSAYTGESSYDIYTIPRSNSSSLSITAKAFNASESIVKSGEYSNVPVEQNKVTDFAGNFFTGSSSTDPSQQESAFQVVTNWSDTLSVTY